MMVIGTDGVLITVLGLEVELITVTMVAGVKGVMMVLVQVAGDKGVMVNKEVLYGSWS